MKYIYEYRYLVISIFSYHIFRLSCFIFDVSLSIFHPLSFFIIFVLLFFLFSLLFLIFFHWLNSSHFFNVYFSCISCSFNKYVIKIWYLKTVAWINLVVRLVIIAPQKSAETMTISKNNNNYKRGRFWYRRPGCPTPQSRRPQSKFREICHQTPKPPPP